MYISTTPEALLSPARQDVYKRQTSDPSAIIKEDYADCTVQIDAGMTNGRYESTEALTGKIRGRGHSTWEWPKKPYKIKLDDKASLLGMSEAKRCV